MTYDVAAAERVMTAITMKRAGHRLPADLITRVIHDYVANSFPDYQMAAWLATVAAVGLDDTETSALTKAYVTSGDVLDVSALAPGNIIDKHSTGGVGDKVSLFVVPVVASCGVPVVKLTGAGLGFMGGTADKLSSIGGLRTDLGPQEVPEILAKTNMVVSSQSDGLVPGDKATYKLRDVTATVDSPPLIAASIMSKKIAMGSDGVVLDVKFGRGAVLPTVDSARRLASLMIRIAADAELPCRAILSDMDQPLGFAVGNALEVAEAVRALQGETIYRYSELCGIVSRHMLQLGRPGLSDAEADREVTEAIRSGTALRQLRMWVEAQGGDTAQVDDLALLPRAPQHRAVLAPDTGYVSDINPRAIGEVAQRLGAGRLTHGQPIDPAAGVVLMRRVGDPVQQGEQIAVLHYGGCNGEQEAKVVEQAYHISPEPPNPRPLVLETLTTEDVT